MLLALEMYWCYLQSESVVHFNFNSDLISEKTEIQSLKESLRELLQRKRLANEFHIALYVR